MSVPAQSVTLLVMTAQAVEAERIITSLRNGGLAVRGMYSAHADRIGELAERRACDIVVACAYDPDVDLQTILWRHGELEADIPLVVIADHHAEPADMVQALRAGARDVTERDDQEHLQLVVARELADLRTRRQARRLARRLQQCEQRARELVETTGEAVAFVQDGLHVHCNDAYLHLFGFPALDDAQAVTFLDLVEAEQRPGVREFLRSVDAGDNSSVREHMVTCIRPDTTRFQARLFAASSELDGERCLRIIVRDRGADTDAAMDMSAGDPALQTSAGYEALMALLEQRLGREREVERPFSLVVMRAREATALLREMGLSRGRDLVGQLGLQLAGLLGAETSAYRLSDDAFGFISELADSESLNDLAERIRSEVRLARPSGDASEPDCILAHLVLSGRAAPAIDLIDKVYRATHGETPAAAASQEPPRKATSLAARDKQLGNAEEDDDLNASKVEWALDNERLILVYQPIVSLMGDNQENYTVLVRLIDDQENLVEACDFIGAAIRHGLIERVDKWAIRKAIEAMGEHRKSGHNLNFFINLAEDTFRDPGIIIWICDCLREFDVRGSWLTFVFQEELVAGNLGSLNKLIDGLKKIKCRVAVNRFGATDRSKALFQAISLDFVLLMPDYAQGLADDKEKQQQLMTLANLAREYNVKSVVTGVEDARSLTILWTAGVDYVQGNFLQRPSPTLEVVS